MAIVFGCRNFKEISRYMSESRTAGACKAFYAKHNSRLDLDGIVQDRIRLGNRDVQESRLASVSPFSADV